MKNIFNKFLLVLFVTAAYIINTIAFAETPLHPPAVRMLEVKEDLLPDKIDIQQVAVVGAQMGLPHRLEEQLVPPKLDQEAVKTLVL